MGNPDVSLKETPAIIVQYEIAAITGAKREIEYKNLIMIVGDHKMIIPHAKLIINGGIDVSDNRPEKRQGKRKNRK